ncbi:putative Diguanylate cyclase with PAS/PAC sensor [Candidatus Terasakiella magnetica]|uniref:diguanylate cyclase n=1 Tax=Candidatus Terasakiella magnetica TaxID=1867952 RepID=A0A1C3RHS4_9PROT|nr:sensor domain-containing diguanylate cyclase [Candidatus Terasakiella magnetica]SCA56815.1 putative Diguanylate cyclase with PAS/PAC sensor [Candidatus Terasakiella magnetica]
MTDFFWDDTDGTEQAVQTQQHLIDTQERMGALLDLLPNVIPMGLLIHQPQAMLFVNNEICRMFNTSHDDMLGKHLLDFMTDELRERLLPLFMQAFDNPEPINLTEVDLHTSDGKCHIVNISIGKLPWEGLNCVQIVLQDVTELIMKERELVRLSMTDPLTGAYNRRYFMQESVKVLEHANENDHPLSLIIFDLDWFKNINDTYGHEAGDDVLKMIVSLWHENSRHLNISDERNNDSHLARIGGEEFAVTLPETDVTSAMGFAERIRKQLEETLIKSGEHSIKVTGSFGVTTYQKGDTLDDMFSRADKALYQSKENGRNQVTSS